MPITRMDSIRVLIIPWSNYYTAMKVNKQQLRATKNACISQFEQKKPDTKGYGIILLTGISKNRQNYIVALRNEY